MKLKRRIYDTALQIKESVKEKRSVILPVEFFDSGCTTLNLALSSQTNAGWPRARINNIVGDGSSGKTLLCLEAFFRFLKSIPDKRSNIFPKVKNIKAIYNNREGVMDFPLDKMYGEKFKSQIDWRCSRYIEQLGANIVKEIDDCKKGDAVIYACDSWDAFSAIAESKRLRESIKNEDAIKGSYNQEKNKYAQDLFEEISALLRNNAKDFTLFIVSQTREKINVSFGKKKYRTGGAALDFYTHIAAWIRDVDKLEKTINKEKRIYGIESEIHVERSKVAKPFRKSRFTIRFDYGLDDILSMCHYMTERGLTSWRNFSLKDPSKFIRYIEKNNLERKLKKHIGSMWNEIEQKFENEIECRKQKCL